MCFTTYDYDFQFPSDLLTKALNYGLNLLILHATSVKITAKALQNKCKINAKSLDQLEIVNESTVKLW